MTEYQLEYNFFDKQNKDVRKYIWDTFNVIHTGLNTESMMYEMCFDGDEEGINTLLEKFPFLHGKISCM